MYNMTNPTITKIIESVDLGTVLAAAMLSRAKTVGVEINSFLRYDKDIFDV
jgi:hypothetical protein